MNILFRKTLAIALFLVAMSVFACVQPANWGANHTWAPGQAVTVYIDSSFDTTHVASIQQAFTNYQNDQQGSSKVTFTFISGNAPDGQNTYNVYNYISAANNPDNSTRGATGGTTTGVYRTNAYTQLNPSMTDSGAILQNVVHEIGHTFGLKDCSTCGPTDSIMAPATCMNCNNGLNAPTQCDDQTTQGIYDGVAGGTCSNCTCPPGVIGCCTDPCCSGATGKPCSKLNTPPTPYGRCTPIILDLSQRGFHLTNAENGVPFDIFANGTKQQIPWPAEGSNNAWLVLDRNGNGVVDDATELFGNLTPQTASADPNGFRALAEFDRPSNGGNGDGLIDKLDAVYSKLRLWIDKNHNGVSEPDELITLEQAGIEAIDLNVALQNKRDANGNVFRYRSKVDQRNANGDGWHTCYDVILVNAVPDSKE